MKLVTDGVLAVVWRDGLIFNKPWCMCRWVMCQVIAMRCDLTLHGLAVNFDDGKDIQVLLHTDESLTAAEFGCGLCYVIGPGCVSDTGAAVLDGIQRQLPKALKSQLSYKRVGPD